MTTVDGAPSGFETVACPMCGPRGEKILFEIVESNDPRQPRTWRGSARIPVVRCQVCGLVFLNPRYDEGRLHAIYQDPKIFSETVDPDGRRRNISSERVRRVKAFEAEVRALRKVCGGGRILDVGCGLGFFLEAAMPFFDGVGLDWSKVAVEEANRRGIRVVESRFPDHPFSTGMFDLVTLFSTLDHLSNPLSALRQVFTLLKKNGWLVLTVPNIASLSAILFRKDFRLLSPNHFYYFSPKTIRRILHASGFRVVKIEFPYFGTEHARPFFHGLQLFAGSVLNAVLRPKKGWPSPPFYGNVMRVWARPVSDSFI